jgi:hypothetical protein
VIEAALILAIVAVQSIRARRLAAVVDAHAQPSEA